MISDSRNITFENNVIDARPNTNKPHLVLVTAGGTQFKNPADVAVISNILINGSATKTWYLQPGSGPQPSANIVVPPAPQVP